MKRRYFLVITCVTMLLTTGCQKSSNELTDVLSTNTQTNNQINTPQSEGDKPHQNLTKAAIVDFPVLIDELSLLIHPVAPIPMYNNKSKMTSSFDSDNPYSTQAAIMPVNSFNKNTPFHYTTRVNNLVFESVEKNLSDNIIEKKHTLFNHNNFLITEVFYPHHISTRSLVCYTHDTKQQYCEHILNYSATQKDSNSELVQLNSDERVVIKKETMTKELFDTFIYKVQEQQLTKDELDDVKGDLHVQQSLYMSDAHGRNMKKLHAANQYITDTKWMPQLKRYYFTTREDSNANKILDFADKQFNYMIDFTSTEPTVVSYTLF